MANQKETYCRKCGERLVSREENYLNIIKASWASMKPVYSTRTGKKIDYSGLLYECPNSKWYSIDHSSKFVPNSSEIYG